LKLSGDIEKHRHHELPTMPQHSPNTYIHDHHFPCLILVLQ